MFKEKCFTEEWLQSFKRQAAHRRIDIIILEKNDLRIAFIGTTSAKWFEIHF